MDELLKAEERVFNPAQIAFAEYRAAHTYTQADVDDGDCRAVSIGTTRPPQVEVVFTNGKTRYVHGDAAESLWGYLLAHSTDTGVHQF